MVQVFIPSTESVALAALQKAAWAGAKVHLYTAIVNPPSNGSILVDFTEATFTGYSDATVTAWGGPFLDSGQQGVLTSGSGLFPGPTAGSGQTILGVFITDGASAVLLAVGPFESPVPLNIPTDFLIVNIQIGPAGNGTVTVSGSFNP
jgi:hypothetical protein